MLFSLFMIPLLNQRHLLRFGKSPERQEPKREGFKGLNTLANIHVMVRIIKFNFKEKLLLLSSFNFISGTYTP